jgi:TPP-dependent pyruvate/acetoin dehydrogenase alpha subunit
MAEGSSRRAKTPENPLVPHKRLRELWLAMAQARMVEEACAKALGRRRGARLRLVSMRGEEAVRAGAVLQLEPGDLVSDCTDSAGMEFLLGAKPKDVLRQLTGGAAAKNPDPAIAARRVPAAADAGARLLLAAGAAAALKPGAEPRPVVVSFLKSEEMESAGVQAAIRVAAEHELPILMYLLPADPAGGRSSGTADLSTRRGELGLPIFPVDGADALALYRVGQESFLRARTVGGPAMVECLRLPPLEGGDGDPVAQMRRVVVAKGAATEGWVSGQERAFAARLERMRAKG